MVLSPLAVVLGLVAATFTAGGHEFHRRTLENGLEALAVDDGEGGTISVFVVYGVGTRAETAETTGLAHLVEHAMFTGTARTPAGGHDAAVQALGGESNAYTRDDFTAYYAHRVPPGALAQVLALEADRMRGLVWREADFLHERERLRTEEASGDRSMQVAARRDHAVWRGRGYGAGVLDAEGHTRGPGLTLERARAFYDAWYHPRNAAVVVVGGAPAAALDAVARAFSGLAAGPAPPALALDPPADRPTVVTLDASLTRDRLEWVWVGPSLAEPLDRVALELLAELLDPQEGAGLEVTMGGRVGRDLFVLAGTGPDAEAQVRAAWSAALEAPLDEAALEAARARLQARRADRPLRSRPYFSLAVDVAVLAALGHVEHAAAEPFVIDALTARDVRAAAARWLAADRRTTLSWRATAAVAPLPTDAEGIRAAAEAAEASGDLERAVAAYERLIALGPGRIDLVIYRYQLGALHRRLGRLEEARRQLKAGLAVVEYPALRDLLGEVEAELARRPGGLPPDGPPPAPPPSRLPPGHP